MHGTRCGLLRAAMLCVGLVQSGCMIGPNFQPPPARVAPTFAHGPTTRVSTEARIQPQWWTVFGDPVLEKLVEMAWRENLPLQVAGLRVLQARATRGIAVGEFFPQLQRIDASYDHVGVSRNNAVRGGPRFYDSTSLAFSATWELDLWGKFRRGIESADASLYASVMNYDDALVTLTADVASTYITLRGLDERLQLAQKNVETQQESLRIANVIFRAGGGRGGELDVQQAKAQLANTQALIPALQQSRRQAENQLCVLLGIPPQDLAGVLGADPRPIPAPPENVAAGIPADLLRRRPDIRRAEAAAAAQCARIGIAAADLLPHFYISGTVGYTAQNPGDVFRQSSLAYQAGPGFRWDVLNYGRIINNVRLQDALFEESLAQYQNTVLAAQQDVSDSITAFVRSREQAQFLAESVTASARSVELSMTQYKAGGVDFIRVLNATQALLQEQDSLVVSRINIANSVVSLNRALGGGWEIRRGGEFVPPQTLERMRQRTDWGDILRSDYDSRSDLLVFPRAPSGPRPVNIPPPATRPATPPGAAPDKDASGDGPERKFP